MSARDDAKVRAGAGEAGRLAGGRVVIRGPAVGDVGLPPALHGRDGGVITCAITSVTLMLGQTLSRYRVTARIGAGERPR